MQYKKKGFYTTEMADQELTKKINSKIGMLKLTTDGLPRTFVRNQLKEITKIATFIEYRLEQIQDLKRQVQEAMFENEKEVEEISKWGGQLEDRLEEFLQGRKELEATIEKLRIAEKEKSKTEETELEEVKLQKKIQEDLKVEDARVKKTRNRRLKWN